MSRLGSARDERRLILLSAGTADLRRDVRDLAQRLAAGVDWARLAETLRSRKLLPVLGPRILDLAGGLARSDFASEVHQSIEAGRRQGAFLQMISAHVMAMLAEAGIRSAALKGPLLGEAIHGDAGRRLSSDVDLLVSPEQLSAAVEVARGLGYAAPTDYVQENGLPLLHFVLVHEREELPPVELHWRVHWYETSFAQERLLPPAIQAESTWRPAPVDELAALLLFYARDGFVDLRLASDISAWWDAYGADLSLGALDEILISYPELSRVIPAAVEAAERTVGLPRVKVLEQARPLGLRQRVAAHLVNPNPSSSGSQLYADVGLIDGLLAPPGGLGSFVRRQVLPPSEVLDQHARHGDRQRARAPLGRGLGTLARYGVTLTRLVRAAEAPR